MTRFSRSFITAAMMATVLASALMTSAQGRNDREVRDALRGISSKLDSFEYSLTGQLRSSSANRDAIDQAAEAIRGLRTGLREFQSNYDRKRETRQDVGRLVDAGRAIDSFLIANQQNRSIQNDWNSMRSQIDRLAAAYGVTPSWEDGYQPGRVADQRYPVQKGSVVVGLSGTYSLDTSRSESLDDAIGNVNITVDQRQDLKDKLESPAQIAIDIRGSQVTLATSNASPVTVVADGREKTEPDGNGASIRLKASVNGSDLVMSSLGGETDYTVTFSSLDGGRTLKVSRRITTDYLDQTVFAESIYNKTDEIARLGINQNEPVTASNRSSSDPNDGYSDNDQGNAPANGGSPGYGGSNNRGTNSGRGPRTVTGRTGDFVVPNGEIITGTLDNEINTNVSQDNDRFRMTVTAPSEFRGAKIEGYISGVNRSGRATGRSNVTFNFEKITLTNGKSYDFAGNLQSLTDQNGKQVRIDSEGTAQGGSRTVQTAKRGGIGAGIGAIIGAIAGGGTGAAIGAAIGAGAGAGSVMVQGRNDIQLLSGSIVTVQSSSPIRQISQPIDN